MSFPRVFASSCALTLTIWMVPVVSAQTSPRVSVSDLMSAAEYQRCGLQKLTDQEGAALDVWLSSLLVKLGRASSASPSQLAGGLEALEGALIIAQDGQFLGKITRNSADRDSITNTVGPYGSEVSSTSIFNSVGKYGSEVSSSSPFNSVASTPPRIFKGDKFVCYLTVNTVKQPRVDPHLLEGWLKSQ